LGLTNTTQVQYHRVIYTYTQSPVIQVINFHSWMTLDQLTRPLSKIYAITGRRTTSIDKLPWMQQSFQ
jgi:hypothetical protein